MYHNVIVLIIPVHLYDINFTYLHLTSHHVTGLKQIGYINLQQKERLELLALPASTRTTYNIEVTCNLKRSD